MNEAHFLMTADCTSLGHGTILEINLDGEQ
jgi:hypothetical protein